MQHLLAQQLTATMASIHQRGWCEGTGGNFSCVLQREPLQLLMAPSGVAKGSVPPEKLIVVDGAGLVRRGLGKASAETLLHLAIVEQTGAGAVLHTHSQAATLLSQRLGQHQPAELLLSDLEMLKGLAGISTHATTVALPVLPNDQDLERLSAAARPLLSKAPQGLLIAGHGLYAWGQDLSSAQRHLEILEFLLEQRWRQLLLAPQELTPTEIAGVTHLLLDIEGTTCPVSYVSNTLFPYASNSVDQYLQINGQNAEVKALIEAISHSWQTDADASAAGLAFNPKAEITAYIKWLIQNDRKLTPLKQLQGLIWKQGYAAGQLQAPLFEDVPAALQRWWLQGLTLAVYSSGSIGAQQLLYGHSNAGDIKHFFSHWFDTNTGGKQQAQSYNKIAEEMKVAPGSVLFISDVKAELEAAAAAGMQVLFSYRSDNPQRDAGGFAKIERYSLLQISS
jgi:2,3-diketo-5-methylthio-1-phosphopentane phosphatase/methylthioribulose-1-phosphate dehydratase